MVQLTVLKRAIKPQSINQSCCSWIPTIFLKWQGELKLKKKPKMSVYVNA